MRGGEGGRWESLFGIYKGAKERTGGQCSLWSVNDEYRNIYQSPYCLNHRANKRARSRCGLETHYEGNE